MHRGGKQINQEVLKENKNATENQETKTGIRNRGFISVLKRLYWILWMDMNDDGGSSSEILSYKSVVITRPAFSSTPKLKHERSPKSRRSLP